MRRSDFIFKYRVRNLPEYNKAPISRGASPCGPTCKRCPPGVGEAVRRVVRALGLTPSPRRMRPGREDGIHLSLRATQGLLESVVRLMEVDRPVPAYSTVCRRQAGLDLWDHPATARQPRHVVIDTTGLKVFGAGEWYVRKHGVEKSRRRTWRKLHLVR